MSAAATAPAPTKSKAFFDRHAGYPWSPIFNDHMEDYAADPETGLEARVLDKIRRDSWGNHSDCAVHKDGVIETQTEIARELETSKQRVNECVNSLVARGYLKRRGRELCPVRSPAKSCSTSGTQSGEKAKTRYEQFQEYWEATSPEDARLEKYARSVLSEIKAKKLPAFKKWRKENAAPTPRTNDPEEPATAGPDEDGQPDAETEESRTSEPPNLTVLKTENVIGERGAFSTQEQEPPPADENPAPPRPAPQTPIQEALKASGLPIQADDPIAAKFEALPAEHDIPAECVAMAIRQKQIDNTRKGDPVESAGGMLFMLTKSGYLTKWIAAHQQEIDFQRQLNGRGRPFDAGFIEPSRDDDS